MEKQDIKSILIIGMAGSLAKVTADLLTKRYPDAQITGVDSRKCEHTLISKNVHFHRIEYTRGNFEKLFRNHKFDVVFHLARVTHAQANPRANLAKRLDLNIMGTKRILDLSLKFGVKKVVVLSTYHVYGAYVDNPIYINEEAPLRASIKYPELHDVVEMDQLCSNWMWKNQDKVETIVFRPCSIIGPQVKNAMTLFLTTPYAPMPVDYNPMMQFVHVFDVGMLLTECLESVPTGVYNVAPQDTLTMRQAKRMIGVPTIPFPIIALEQMAKLINKTFFSVPNYLIEYLKFPCLIDNSQIKEHFNQKICNYTTASALESLNLK